MSIHPVWVGMAEVTRGPGCELDLTVSAIGHFVWWAAQAMNGKHFKQRVEAACKQYGLLLYGFEDIQPAIMLHQPAEYLADLASRAAEDANFVLYGTFNSYGRHDA